jgi:hypothetical protein
MSDDVLVSKVVNALVEDATSPAEKVQPIGGAIDRVRQKSGGIWVGGRATLTPTTLRFAPNGLNKLANDGPLESEVSLASVHDVQLVKGFVTNIVDVHHDAGRLRVRCYGAKRFAEEIQRAVAAVEQA